MDISSIFFFWSYKTPSDNAWRPVPGASPTKHRDNLPAFLKRTDLQAAVVDTAPVVAGAGGFAHLSQLPQFGFTARASIFRNPKTMLAMHRSLVICVPLVLALQSAGVEYRSLIPRWAHEREQRRDEAEVRKHVDVGMGIGALSWVVRLYFLRVGRAYWAPLDAVMGGALADLAHREYCKAHGL